MISDSSGVSRLISVARSKIGSPYVWGAKGPNSFDCSGFVYWCLNQVGVNQSYITSSGWRTVGKYTKITDFGDIKKGDMVSKYGQHIGMAACDIKMGEHVHTHNIESKREDLHD